MQTSFRETIFLAALIMILVLWGCQPASDSKHPKIVIATMYGNIIAELYPDKAPVSAGSFLRFIDSGFYTNAAFYRILSDENQPMGSDAATLIQGGLWAGDKRRDYLRGIRHENTGQTGILHEAGTLSMARQDTGTANTEFFICINRQPGFDYGGENNPDGQGYAAFGKVIEGMDVVMKIYRQTEENQLFNPPVPIKSIKRK